MKIVLIVLLIFSQQAFAQKQFTFISDYQLDKTCDGSKKPSSRNAVISFTDPKSLASGEPDYENSPKGYMTIKFQGIQSAIWEEVIFISKDKSNPNTDIYAISKTSVDWNIAYVMKHDPKVKGFKPLNKFYKYVILMGYDNGKTPGELPQYYTAFYCNLTK